MLAATRWLLVVPAAIAAWYVVFIAGIITHSEVEGLCPPQDMVSGACMNPRIIAILDVIVCVFVALSALAVEIAAVATAPSHRGVIIWATFATGALLTVGMGWSIGAWAEMASALIAGLIGAVAMDRYLRRAATAD